MPPPVHLPIQTQCGICSCVLVPKEGYRSVLGNKDSTTYERVTEIAAMPNYRYANFRRAPTNDREICRFPHCSQCAKSPETATVHWDCFHVIDAYNVPREILWTALAWRLPWKNCPTLFLTQRQLPRSVYTASDLLGIPLGRLPSELVYLIQHYSRDAKFWRYCAAADLGLELSEVVHATTESRPLAAVLRWERGSTPTTTSNCTTPSAVRLSIDARGISKVERIPADQPSGPSDGMRYAIFKPVLVDNTMVHFRDGMVRVQPLDTATIDIWDIADPPVLEPYLFYPRSLPRLLHTIDPCRIFGLTFLMNAMGVFGLHCHTRDRPTVESAMELLGPTIPDDLSCLYVPLPPGERILAVDVRRGAWQDHTYCIQIRTLLAGDIVIGPYEVIPGDLPLPTSPPRMLVYDTPELGRMTSFAAYPQGRAEKASSTAHQVGPQDLPRKKPLFYPTNYTTAPLRGVVRALTFPSPDGHHSRAMILHYADGAQRALGDCRVGIDQPEVWEMPRCICICNTVPTSQNMLRLTKFRFSEPDHEQHTEPGWTCHDMSGIVELWFGGDEFRIRILGGSEIVR